MPDERALVREKGWNPRGLGKRMYRRPDRVKPETHSAFMRVVIRNLPAWMNVAGFCREMGWGKAFPTQIRKAHAPSVETLLRAASVLRMNRGRLFDQVCEELEKGTCADPERTELP